MGALSILWSFLAMVRMDKARWSIDQSLLTGVLDEEPINKLVAESNSLGKRGYRPMPGLLHSAA